MYKTKIIVWYTPPPHGILNLPLVYLWAENDVLKNMAKWTKIQDTQITIPQNDYALIYMMAELHLAKSKE